FRMVQLPIGVFGVAISIAAMPVLARYAAKKDMDGLRQTFTSSLLMVFSLTIPATAGLVLLAQPIIRLIFEHGAFTALDTVQTAAALTYYAYGLFAYSAVKIMVPVFYALNNTKYPVIGSFLAVAANIVLITLTIDQFQHRAIALSTSCVMILNFFFLGSILYRKLSGYSLVYIGSGLAKIFLSTMIMSGGLWWVKGLVSPYLQGSIAVQLVLVFSLILVGAVLYGVTLHFLKLPELELITEKISRRLKK
ncbi:MAG: polysaccharide biosynthesis C-terminal domain-containing protein, partial [Desulfobulbaceae bacterium]|nr:polysaccharide biosynthesis C-terminal domain-containing protein [Desulfobulbaceae bacterium]